MLSTWLDALYAFQISFTLPEIVTLGWTNICHMKHGINYDQMTLQKVATVHLGSDSFSATDSVGPDSRSVEASCDCNISPCNSTICDDSGSKLCYNRVLWRDQLTNLLNSRGVIQRSPSLARIVSTSSSSFTSYSTYKVIHNSIYKLLDI